MNTAAQIKDELREALSEASDEELRKEGFSRSPRALFYRRRFVAAEHQIVIGTECHPRYQPEGAVRIHPMVLMKIPEVSDKALALVEGNSALLASAPDIILNQPLEHFGPKETFPRWYGSSKAEYLEAASSIVSYVKAWVLPFLLETSTPTGLIRAYEASDARVSMQAHSYVYVAAAYCCVGEPDKASQVVLERFQSASLRRRYSSLFESLGMDVMLK